jgi:hypothetical protein
MSCPALDKLALAGLRGFGIYLDSESLFAKATRQLSALAMKDRMRSTLKSTRRFTPVAAAPERVRLRVVQPKQVLAPLVAFRGIDDAAFREGGLDGAVGVRGYGDADQSRDRIG